MPAPLRILVAGAGIGGLAAALACSRAGHHVQVFEKSEPSCEAGAGIQLGPNVTRILQQWGLTQELQNRASFPECLQVRDAATGQQLGRLPLGKTMAARYAAPYATLHRADLHQMLAGAWQGSQGQAPAFGHEVAGFTQDGAAAHLNLTRTDGRSLDHQGDLIVGADGLWSRVRQVLLGDGAPQDSGHMALRRLIRQSDLPLALRVSLHTEDVSVWLGPRLHLVHYPVRGGEWLNLVVIVENPAASASGDWSQLPGPDELGLHKMGLNASLRALLELPDGAAEPASASSPGSPMGWRKWNLFTRPPLQSAQGHGHGRVALLGDAAHPMLPYLAQGAGMAIEDAQVLAASLSRLTDMPNRIQHFAQARWQRNARVQRRAIHNGQIFHASGAMRWGRDVAMRLLGERLLDMPWLYGAGQGDGSA